MSRRLPKRDPIAAYKREVTAARRIGEGRRCGCGETRPGALIAGSDPIICGECDRHKKGMTPNDDHHVAAAANDPLTLPVPVNDHRAELNDAQADWPKQTLENRDGSPLLAGAGCIRGYVDTTLYLVAKLLLPKAEMLETLDEHLAKEFGPGWWKGTKLEKFRGQVPPK